MKFASQTILVGTPCFSWKSLRALGAEDLAAAPALTGGSYDLDNVSCAVDLYELFGNSFKGLMLAFYGGTSGEETLANADDFDFDLLGWRTRDVYNPPMLLANTTADGCAFGTLTSLMGVYGVTGAYYLSTLTLNFSDSPCVPIVDDSGNNRTAFLVLPELAGIRYIYPYVHGADGATDGEAPAVGVLATPIY